MRIIRKVGFVAGVLVVGSLVGLLALTVWGGGLTPATAASPRVQTFDVILGEGEVIGEGTEKIIGEFHRWEPAVLVVHRGDQVVLNVKNPRKHLHSLAFPALGVTTKPLEPRKGQDTIKFVAEKSGTFPFICGIPWGGEGSPQCDADHARMVGHLIVLE